MRFQSLVHAMKLASRVSNPSSLAALYKSVEIGADRIRACSEFGNIEIVTDETGLDEPALIDCSTMQETLSSLSPEVDLYLSRTGDVLSWETESGEGSWSIIEQPYTIPEINHDNYPWQPPEYFAGGLRLASLSVQAATVSIGIYGVVLQRTESELKLLSCNDDSESVVTFIDDGFPASKVTIRPPVPALLADVLTAFPDCIMDVKEQGIFVLGDSISSHFPLAPELERDLLSLAEPYSQVMTVAAINSAAMMRALRRAKPDEIKRSMIQLSVESGNLMLRHEAKNGRSQEVWQGNGLDPSLSVQPVNFPTHLIMAGLEHCDEFCLDYMGENTLVMLGQDPLFQFIVSGERGA